MNKLLYKYISALQLIIAVLAVLLISSCEDEETNPPIVAEIRNYAASPLDTAVQVINSGQWVVIVGQNLSTVNEVYFASTRAPINPTFISDQSIVVQVPNISFQSVPADKVNEMIIVSSLGTTIFQIDIVGAPMITQIRNFDTAPNDTILNAIEIGQQINLIGFNLKGATRIAFQGININLDEVIYTDSSAIVKVPDDFSNGDPSLANKITYVTQYGTQTFSIPIFDPAIIEYYKDPLWIMLTGGVGNEKAWKIDFNTQGVSQKFAGPMWFSGEDLRWEFGCGAGGNCWNWAPEWQTWMPAPADYGTMTFKLKGIVPDPVAVINQKALSTESKNGTFSGGYFFDIENKTITFTDVVPLNMGWDNVDWTKAYVITLTDDGMQLGFKNKGKAELELYNYIPK